MAELTDNAVDSTATEGEETEELRGELTPGGRYIPYSGGSAGWFENSGVLKSERRNNYQYHVEMDLPEVRAKQFLRWGPEQDRRQGARERVQLAVNLLQEGATIQMRTWDINNRGIRLQFTEPPGIAEGDELSVEVLDHEDGEVQVMLDCQVIWVQQAGATRPVWNMGMFFPNISPDAAVTLAQLLHN